MSVMNTGHVLSIWQKKFRHSDSQRVQQGYTVLTNNVTGPNGGPKVQSESFRLVTEHHH